MLFDCLKTIASTVRDVYYANSLHGDSDSDDQRKIQEEAALVPRETISEENEKARERRAKLDEYRSELKEYRKRNLDAMDTTVCCFYFPVCFPVFVSNADVVDEKAEWSITKPEAVNENCKEIKEQ